MGICGKPGKADTKPRKTPWTNPNTRAKPITIHIIDDYVKAPPTEQEKLLVKEAYEVITRFMNKYRPKITGFKKKTTKKDILFI